MKFLSLLRPTRFVVGAFLLSCAGLALWSVWRVPTVRGEQDFRQDFYARVRGGVGDEVSLAVPGASTLTVKASVDSLSNFMYSRSGVALNESVKNRLAEMEARALAGTARQLTPDELSDILAETALERIATLSPQQIEYVAEMFRGFNDPRLPESFQRGRSHVHFRASSGEGGTPDEFIGQLTKIKEADPISSKIYSGAARSLAAQEVVARIGTLSAAVPNKYGAVKSHMTPLQAVLIAYAVASDDSLCDSAANLSSSMQATQTGVTNVTGETYPNPDNYRAYGPNGYLFSSPLDLYLMNTH